MKHYIDPYLISKVHAIKIAVIGAGGNGALFITNLAKIAYTLKQIHNIDIHVTLYDADVVTEANLGRQPFSRADIGLYKAELCIERVNRFYGFNWNAINEYYEQRTPGLFNIIVTCTDNVKSRRLIQSKHHDLDRCCYWLDLGNTKTSAQVILGTLKSITQPDNCTIQTLPTILDLYPNLKDDKETPSCSLAESLTKQSLFINGILVQYASNLLWNLFNNFYIEEHGVFINLSNYQTKPLLIK